jgi:hypothetical protein
VNKLKAAVVAAGVAVIGSIAGAGAVAAAPKAPDLVVTGVQWAPDPVAGEKVLFTATIKNTGNAPTPAGVIHGVGFQLDGKLVTWADAWTQSLQPGQWVTVTAVGGPTGQATWTATAGNHRLRAFVDDAKRMSESNEGNNTLDTTLTVGAGMTHRIQSGNVVTSLTPVDSSTLTATSVTGNAYAGCFTADGALVDGTERYLQTRSVGNDTFAIGSKWQDGLAQVPAGATSSRTWVSFSQLIYGYQGHFPIDCAAGQTPNFTRFEATSVKTTRWLGAIGAQGRQLASVTTPVDVDFDVQP